jgi:lipoprotein-anchoring transpeptidase ErfK/SrfK
MERSMSRLNLLSAVLTACLATTAATAPAQATVRIHIDLATQRMHVDSSSGSWNWPVSTARDGYVTPPGEFEPTGMERMHYSQKYDNAPMPYSIFFYGGYAIHGSYATGSLGRPASHGCVRLSPAHARKLYEMVEAEGATISIAGEAPTQAWTSAGADEEAPRESRASRRERRATQSPVEEFSLF